MVSCFSQMARLDGSDRRYMAGYSSDILDQSSSFYSLCALLGLASVTQRRNVPPCQGIVIEALPARLLRLPQSGVVQQVNTESKEPYYQSQGKYGST